MYCDDCGDEVEGHFNFCPGCGETISSDIPGIAPSIRNNLTEEEAIRFYFARGFQYNSILIFLSKSHAINISHRTLLNRLNEYTGSDEEIKIRNEGSLKTRWTEQTIPLGTE